MTFPQGFKEKYTQLLGEEAMAFFQTFDEPAVSAYRTNPLKAEQIRGNEPIPGMPWSYYGKVSGKSVAHVTGLVYSQEPAAQMVAQVAHPSPGMKVLDLAAAPGGKTTHLLSYLDNQGLLISNEIHKGRSKILVENVERFGARNVVVTNESAERLAKVFPAYFDLIVLDAPCSGEGMFRKQPDAMDYWSVGYPRECSLLQREILEDALKMLVPGGSLVYSTCTWAPEENEEIVSWLIEEYELELLPIEKINGMVEGIGYPETARMYPHRFKGEGQFVAKFLYKGEPEVKKIKEGRSNLTAEQKKLWQAFAKDCLAIDLEGLYQCFGDQLYLLPVGLPDLKKVKMLAMACTLEPLRKIALNLALLWA